MKLPPDVRRTLVAQGLEPRCPRHPTVDGSHLKVGNCRRCTLLRRAWVEALHAGGHE